MNQTLKEIGTYSSVSIYSSVPKLMNTYASPMNIGPAQFDLDPSHIFVD
jgi:hypothetical protein